MIYAERGNKVRQIGEEDIAKYTEQGYKITDGYGNIIQDSIPNDLGVLKLAYVNNRTTIEELHKEITTLKAENDALKAENNTLKATATTKRNTKKSNDVTE